MRRGRARLGRRRALAAPAYDPFRPGFADDPYPHYRALRDGDPVHETPVGYWLLFRYDDVQRFLRSPEPSVEDRHVRPGSLADRSMLDRDPPDHTRLRRLVSKAFTPHTVDRLRSRVQALVDEALDDAAERGEMDLIGNGTLALLRNRRQLERLRDDPSLDAPAVEELLRYDSPVQMSRAAGAPPATPPVGGSFASPRRSGAFDGVHLVPVSRYRQVAARLEAELA